MNTTAKEIVRVNEVVNERKMAATGLDQDDSAEIELDAVRRLLSGFDLDGLEIHRFSVHMVQQMLQGTPGHPSVVLPGIWFDGFLFGLILMRERETAATNGGGSEMSKRTCWLTVLLLSTHDLITHTTGSRR